MTNRQEVVILSTDALTQLTCTLVKEHCSAAPTSAGSSSIQKNAKEPHPKVYHSVSTKKTQRQQEDEFEKECEVVGAETNTITRPNTLSLDREMSNTSSGSGKTTPCNIPRLPISEQSSRNRSPVEEKLVSSCPPVPMPSFWMSPVQRGDTEVVMETMNGGQQQFLCQAENDVTRLSQQALARRIADRLKIIGDLVTTETDNQHVSDLMENILCSLSSGLTWRGVVRLYRGLSHVLAQWYVEGEAPSSGLCDRFTFVWKQVLRHTVGWIADNGGWNAFICETDHPASHARMMSSVTPEFSRRCSTSDVGHVHYSTPQAPRHVFHTIESSPTLSVGCSARGNESPIFPAGYFSRGNESPILPAAGCRGNERGCHVLSLTEGGMFQLDESLSFLTDSGRYVEEEELKSHDEAVFSNPSSQSSFSDMPESPISLRPRPQSGSLVPDATPSKFDRSKSLSYPSRKRPASARRAGGAEVISEREHSVDSGLEASSEVSLASATSVDSFGSLQFSTLGVSAMCILEAVRLMLDADR